MCSSDPSEQSCTPSQRCVLGIHSSPSQHTNMSPWQWRISAEKWKSPKFTFKVKYWYTNFLKFYSITFSTPLPLFFCQTHLRLPWGYKLHLSSSTQELKRRGSVLNIPLANRMYIQLQEMTHLWITRAKKIKV